MLKNCCYIVDFVLYVSFCLSVFLSAYLLGYLSICLFVSTLSINKFAPMNSLSLVFYWMVSENTLLTCEVKPGIWSL